LSQKWGQVQQTFYALIAIAVIENSDADYKRVSRILTAATVELNASPPTELRARISPAIRNLLDKQAWERAMQVEKVELASIADIAHRIAAPKYAETEGDA